MKPIPLTKPDSNTRSRPLADKARRGRGGTNADMGRGGRMKRRTGKARAAKTKHPAVAARAEPRRSAALAPCASFAVVGIGASAGGLEAFTQLLEHLPPDSGMAFVFIQHLSPTHPSLLGEALSHATRMPVLQVTHGMRVEPDHVYVIPPNMDMEIAGAVLTLRTRADEPRKPHLPVDIFLRSLAASYGSRAIGVILSGTASDGTEGLRAIQAENGITLAQDPRSAKFGGMPQSAVQAGVVDACLPLPQLAQELVRLGRHPYTTLRAKKRGKAPHAVGTLERLFSLVRNAVGVDFSEYRPATFERRLARRMALRRAENLQGYVKVLEQNPDEARALYEDVLIHVTSFFRDPEVFEALKKQVFPALLQHKPAGAPFRVWVPGCSTGRGGLLARHLPPGVPGSAPGPALPSRSSARTSASRPSSRPAPGSTRTAPCSS